MRGGIFQRVGRMCLLHSQKALRKQTTDDFNTLTRAISHPPLPFCLSQCTTLQQFVKLLLTDSGKITIQFITIKSRTVSTRRYYKILAILSPDHELCAIIYFVLTNPASSGANETCWHNERSYSLTQLL